MAKYIFILLLSFSITSVGQNCPPGYEQRNVKCNGSIVTKCVPVDFNCSGCWIIVWPKCNSDERGADNYANSYEDALKITEDRKVLFQNSSCKTVSTNYNQWSIYIREGKYCTSLRTNQVVIDDLKGKIIPFLKRYKAEISNYRRYFSGNPYKPGAIVKEYESMLKQAEDNVKKLENNLNNITDQNLSEIEEAFNDIQFEETKLQQTHTRYESYINSNNSVPKETNTQVLESNTRVPNNQQYQNQPNILSPQYQTGRENYDKVSDILQSGIQKLSDISAKTAQRKEEERLRRYEAEQQWKSQQLEAERIKREEDIIIAEREKRKELYNKGYTAFKNSDYEIAKQLFDQYKKNYPEETYGYYWSYRAKSQIDSTMENGLAVPDCRRFIEIAQSDMNKNKNTLITAYGYMAGYNANILKDFSVAILYLDKILGLDPSNSDAVRNKNILLKALKPNDN